MIAATRPRQRRKGAVFVLVRDTPVGFDGELFHLKMVRSPRGKFPLRRKEAGTVKLSLLLTLVLLFATSPVVPQIPDDTLVVPGQRIGKWTLRMTVDDLTRMNGRDFLEQKGSDEDVRGELLFRHWIPLALSVAYRKNQTRIEYLDVTELRLHFPPGDDTDKIRMLKEKYPDIPLIANSVGVFVGAPWGVVTRYQTDRGISLGIYGNSGRIVEAYGKPTIETAMFGTVTSPKRWIYDAMGVAFKVQDLRATGIFVFRPGTAKSIWKF